MLTLRYRRYVLEIAIRIFKVAIDNLANTLLDS